MITRETVSSELRQAIFERDSYTCQYCGFSGNEADLEIEHIIPVSKGGTNDIRNLCTACRKCNSSKGKRMLTISELQKISDKINSSLEYLISIAYEQPKKTYSKSIHVSVYLQPETYDTLLAISSVTHETISDMVSKSADELAKKNFANAQKVKEALQGITMEY